MGINDNPILPNSYAAFVHPLKAKQNYTEGSDGKAGLSQAEAKQIRNDICSSPVLNEAQEQQALACVDQALATTGAAGKSGLDAKAMQAMLELGRHDLSLQPLNKGSAAPMIQLDHKPLAPEHLKSTLFRVASGTSYAPKDTGVEGGVKDSAGRSLKPHTLEKYLDQIKRGKGVEGKYVAIAIDASLYQPDQAPLNYGDVFRIPEIEKIHGVAPIYFAVVDTGGAFEGSNGGKIDICCENTNNQKVNQTLSLHQLHKPDGSGLNIKDLH